MCNLRGEVVWSYNKFVQFQSAAEIREKEAARLYKEQMERKVKHK